MGGGRGGFVINHRVGVVSPSNSAIRLVILHNYLLFGGDVLERYVGTSFGSYKRFVSFLCNHRIQCLMQDKTNPIYHCKFDY